MKNNYVKRTSSKNFANKKNEKKIQKKLSNYLYKKLSQLQEDPKENETPHDFAQVNMEEELPPRNLYVSNPNLPPYSVRYNPMTKELKKRHIISDMIIHFESEGNLITKDSDEYKVQEEIEEKRGKQLKEVIKSHEIGTGTNFNGMTENPDELKLARKILRNKFNYEEAGIQINPIVIRERGVSTTKAALHSFNCDVNQSDIYEAYMKYSRINKRERMKEMGILGNEEKEKMNEESEAIMHSKRFNKCLSIVERMIVQNNEEEKYHDYRYMFSANDQKLREKSLFPLWRFIYSPNKKNNVTSIMCNPRYSDLFAVSYGSYEFGKKIQNNVITLFTFKNTSYPEIIIPVDDAVMSLDFHPTSPALLCVGLYNGNVLVYDIRTKNKQPIYRSSVRSKKHSDPVWQVKWSPDSAKYNFYSISSDGRVLNWSLMKDLLDCEEIFKLRYVEKKNNGKQDETSLTALACGLCFDFSPFDQFSFIVGTEEGNIHLCSIAYSGDYQETFEGHKLAVYKVKYHPFDSETFLSASADWNVKIWNIRIKQALMTFELGQAVVDIVWSPFCASVFIALSLDKTYVFDLKESRHHPVYENKPVRSKCTNLAINWKDPLLYVGDSHGGVSTFKMSKNIGDPDIDLTNDEIRQKQVEEFKEYLKLGSMID